MWGESVPGTQCCRIPFLKMPVENLVLEYMFDSSLVWVILKTIVLWSGYSALAETEKLISQILMMHTFKKF